MKDENINSIEEKTNTINNSGSNSENNSRTIIKRNCFNYSINTNKLFI